MKSRLIKSIVLIVFGSILLMNIQVLTQGTKFPVNFTREAVAQSDEGHEQYNTNYRPNSFLEEDWCIIWDLHIDVGVIFILDYAVPTIKLDGGLARGSKRDCIDERTEIWCPVKEQKPCARIAEAE